MSQLLDRLTPRYDQTPATTRVMTAAGQAHWLQGWGTLNAAVNTIMTHETDGWPRRDKSSDFVQRYLGPATGGIAHDGVGPQLYISGDGTVARFIDLTRKTYHGEWMNGISVGVETGCLYQFQMPGYDGKHVALSFKVTNDPQDVPGLALWMTSGENAQSEVCPLWETASYTGPGRGAIPDGWNIFSEQQRQMWAVLARYLTAELGLPRNLPLLPHRLRSSTISGAAAGDAFRRSVLADERADMVKRAVAAAPINIPDASFASAAAIEPAYDNAVQAATVNANTHQSTLPAPQNTQALRQQQQNNRAWTAWCKTFRGVLGHGYAGSLGYSQDQNNPALFHPHSEHDCPGALFDFHRLAREISDYWWYPFDVSGGTASVPLRAYRSFTADTPLIEYYFDETEADRTGRIVNGLLGPTSSPDTFTLEPDAPVYAMSNGELVAASFPDPGAGVSLAFTLIRHEVFYQPAHPSAVNPASPAPPAGSIDYDQAPASVYTLYMHLGRPQNMSFQTIVDANPDWLNRLLMRSKECDLGIPLYDGDPTHHGIPQAQWDNQPPGVPQRNTTLGGWRQDKALLDAFFASLSAGQVATLPRTQLTVAARVILGDYLGVAGVTKVQGGATSTGVRVEVMAPTLEAPTFTAVGSSVGAWTPGGAALPACVQYISEWARQPTAAEQTTLTGDGVNLGQLGWWTAIAQAQNTEGSLDATQRLPDNGLVFHYRPLEFAKWINGVTWASEWPKFGVTDATGAAVARPAQPTSRRV